MDYLKRGKKRVNHILVMPIINSAIVPLFIADIWVEFYHRVCFPLCGIELVKRSAYIKIDRQKLSYLGPIQKIYCMYCGYANGLIAYWQEIAGRTEKYWCGIMHEKSPGFIEPEHHRRLEFAEYGNEQQFKDKYK